MSASQRRVAVVFDEAVWSHAVDGFSEENRQLAQSTRIRLERSGLALDDVRACDAEGSDGTKLPGCVKLYLPWLDAPPSQRPFAFVLRLRQRGDELVWNFVAFGPRHPRPGVRSAYERAHRQLHGTFPRHGHR